MKCQWGCDVINLEAATGGIYRSVGVDPWAILNLEPGQRLCPKWAGRLGGGDWWLLLINGLWWVGD